MSGSGLLQNFHMALRHGPSCWCRSCVIDLRRALRDDPESVEEPLVAVDARGFRRMGPYDRPGRRSPVSDAGSASADRGPVEPSPSTPAGAERCESCASLRLSNDQLQLQLEHANSEIARLYVRLEELNASSRFASASSGPGEDLMRRIFTSQESDAAALLRDPLVILRSLRHHEQRLDALVCLQSALEDQLRSRP